MPKKEVSRAHWHLLALDDKTEKRVEHLPGTRQDDVRIGVQRGRNGRDPSAVALEGASERQLFRHLALQIGPVTVLGKACMQKKRH